VNDVAAAEPSSGLVRIAQSALASWGIAHDATLRLLKHRENAVFAVDIDDKPAHVLRVHRRGYHTDAALRSELTWMTALNDHGIPTPRVTPTRQGDFLTLIPASDGAGPFQCDLLSWVAGVPLGNIENKSFGKEEFIERAYEQVGRLAAQVHLHSEQWRPAEPVHRHSWDEEGCCGEDAVWGYYGDLDTLSPPERALLNRAVLVARQRLAEFGKTDDRFGLIHADLVPENVLIDGEACTLIDFDDAGFGWYLADIAIAVFFQVGTASFAPALSAMLRGYRQVRHLPAAHLRMLDVMLFLRGLAVLGWIKTRGETDTAKQIKQSVTEITLSLAANLTGEPDPAYLNVQFELPLALE
jgi:Ser/Thr protein kinase RdoA (MazF antagonist)